MSRQLVPLNGLAFTAMALVNFLAVQLPFFGRRPGDVSDQYAYSFTPADITFSIWSVIYILLFFFIGRQISVWRTADKPLPPEVARIGGLFVATCLCNIAWLVAWQSLHLVLAFGIIFCLWILLIVIYYRLVPFAQHHWTATYSFSIYLAWVSVAALANLNVIILDAGFNRFGLSPEAWTAALVIMGTLGGLLVLWLNRDPVFVLVVIWSFAGIYLKNSPAGADLALITRTAIIGMVILALSSGLVVATRLLARRAS